MELGVSVDSLVLDEWLCLSVQSGWETTGPCSICAFIFTADCMNVLACNIYTTVLLSSLSIRTTTLSLLLFNTQMFVQQHLPNLLWLLSSSLLANNYTRAHVCIFVLLTGFHTGLGATGIPPSPQKFENYDVIITSTATIGYTTQVQHQYRLNVL